MSRSLVVVILTVLVFIFSGCACFIDRCAGGANCGSSKQAANATTVIPASVEPEVAAAQPLKQLLSEELRVVFFDVNKATLTAEARANLDRVAAALKQDPKQGLVAAAYCDSTGAVAKNAALGAARAQSVKNYLAVQGISAERIQTANHGSNGGSARKVELQLLP